MSEPPAAKPSATPAGIPATRTAEAAVAKEHAPLEANAAPAVAASGPDTGAQRSAPQQSSDHRAPADRSTTTDRNSPTSRGGDERAGESADRTHTPADHAELAAPRPDPVDAVMPVLERHGVTLDEFMAMQDRAAQVGRDDLVNHFSTAELQMMYEARMAHPHPDADAVIQKIVSEPAVRSILDQVNTPGAPYDAAGRFHADDVGGCVSVASDAAHLRTPQDLLHAMRLDYGNGSPYETFTTTDHAYVVEGRIGAGDHFVPNGRVTDHLGLSDPHVQDLPSGAPPHTGTGYTGDRHGLNPEYQLVDGKWAPGATLFRVDPNGSRHPVAMLDDSGTAWVAAKAPGDTVADGWPQHEGGEWIFPNSPEHGPHPDPADPAHRGSGFDHADTGPPDPAARRVFEDSAIDTEPGAAFFDPADSEMRDAVGGVPEFPGEFTVDVHGDEHGVSVWDSAGNEHRMSARDFADVFRNHTQWDGHSPIRLLSCDTGADRHGFASELARELGVPVTAPDRPVWTFPDGRQPVVASVELRPNSEERPRIPPDGGWNRFEPDGSMHRSTEHPAAQHTEADAEARARGRDGELPTQLPEAPVQRAQALDEAARRAQESHAARVEEVNSRRADLKALESERRGADEAAKAVLKAEIEAATEELRDAQNRAAESRELLRAVSNAEHSAETAHHEADRAVPIDAAEVAAQRHRVDEIRAEIDEQQDRLRQLAREEADVRARLQQNDDPAVADQLRAERRELLSALREARDTLRDSDATLREAGDALRDSEWDRRSPQDRHEQLSREAAVARRQLADRYAEFVSGDNARAAAEAARGGSAEAAALAHVREVQQASAQARRIDLDVEIRAQIDRAVAQYMESRIRTDGREHPWVARELMSNTDRQAHWPVLDLQHLRQQIAMEMGDAVAWQFDRQMRGLTRCTATEVAQALGIFHDDGIHPSRGGNTPARESFERALAGQLHDEANRLVAEGRFADADAFIAERVAHVVSHLAALHEQDCAGAGADHIQTYMGWPVLADGNINSSLGSIWKQMVLDPDGNPARFYEAIRAVAQRQIAAGRGGEPLDIWYRNLD
ncbi:MAG: polymorphic toxin type 15 domain-containing protein [Mycobacterium sp.]